MGRLVVRFESKVEAQRRRQYRLNGNSRTICYHRRRRQENNWAAPLAQTYTRTTGPLTSTSQGSLEAPSGALVAKFNYSLEGHCARAFVCAAFYRFELLLVSAARTAERNTAGAARASGRAHEREQRVEMRLNLNCALVWPNERVATRARAP